MTPELVCRLEAVYDYLNTPSRRELREDVNAIEVYLAEDGTPRVAKGKPDHEAIVKRYKERLSAAKKRHKTAKTEKQKERHSRSVAFWEKRLKGRLEKAKAGEKGKTTDTPEKPSKKAAKSSKEAPDSKEPKEPEIDEPENGEDPEEPEDTDSEDEPAPKKGKKSDDADDLKSMVHDLRGQMAAHFADETAHAAAKSLGIDTKTPGLLDMIKNILAKAFGPLFGLKKGAQLPTTQASPVGTAVGTAQAAYPLNKTP